MRKQFLVGVDEVGRGPLAGPVTIAVVGGISAKLLHGIRDSKKLTPSSREAWAKIIRAQSTWVIVAIPANTIDRIGISAALRRAVERGLSKLPQKPTLVLLDGSLHAPKEYRQRTIIKGDEKEPLIAAASIIAKVHRDNYMVRMDKKYPEYGFAQHKGYGTREHYKALKKQGMSEIHRRTFLKGFKNQNSNIKK